MLGRAATPLVAAAVVAVVVAAVVDALRGEDGESGHPEAVGELRELGAEGVLTYTGPECGLHAVSLPELGPARVPAGPGRACEASVSPDGRRLAGGAARWDRTGSVYAICRGTRAEVVDPAIGRPQRVHTGCAPAWRPDGALTLALGGAIVEVPGGRVLVSESELRRAARRRLTIPGSPGALTTVVVRDALWLSAARVAVLLQGTVLGRIPQGGPIQVVAFFEGRRRVGRFLSFRPMERLDASPDGRYVAVQPGTVLRDDGTVLELPPELTNVRRLAWSPDGRLLAAATRASVVFVPVADLERGRSPKLVRVPLRVEDLAWR